MWCRTLVAVIVPLLLAAVTLPAEPDDFFAKAAAYKVGETRQWILEVERCVREAGGRPAERKAVEQRLLGMLGNAQATKDAKAFACEQLSLIGSAAAVPALSALLADEALHHAVRMALERIQNDAAGAALRDALGKLDGKLLIGVINSLGERRDAQAAAGLAKLAAGANPETREAAIWALGRIGGPDAAKALVAVEKALPPAAAGVWTDACVSCADSLLQAGAKADAVELYVLLAAPARPSHVRLAALRGLVAAAPSDHLGTIIETLKGDNARLRLAAASLFAGIPGEAATKAFAAEFPAMPPPVQVILLGAFAARG
ncbi:MAG: HEAT repeat domain-containing protein, partial [Planctomycetota bacterium]|nr:HEAT repeat domain-containing protein [Planctomycetota bacterium]